MRGEMIWHHQVLYLQEIVEEDVDGSLKIITGGRRMDCIPFDISYKNSAYSAKLGDQ